MHQILINNEPARTKAQIATAIRNAPGSVRIKGETRTGQYTYGTLAGLFPKWPIAFKVGDDFGSIGVNAAGEIEVVSEGGESLQRNADGAGAGGEEKRRLRNEFRSAIGDAV